MVQLPNSYRARVADQIGIQHYYRHLAVPKCELESQMEGITT